MNGQRTFICTIIAFALIGLAGFAVAGVDEEVQALIARMDELWAKRGRPGPIEELIEVGKQALAIDPRSYESAWRVARAYWWIGYTTKDKKVKKASGLEGMKYGETAIRLNPERVEGHFMYALTVGNYGSSIGVIKAVFQGIASKFQKAALKAYELDKDFYDGAPIVALGRYYHQLPWPKRSLKKSLRYLEEAKRLHPNALRGRLYLAETYYDLGEKEKAREELTFVLMAEPTPGLELEGALAKELAREKLEQWFPEANAR